MKQNRIVFFNIGWMGKYEGFANQADKIVGGGAYVREHGTGHEVCNFLSTDTGKAFGHVETIRGKTDLKIQVINNLGGKDQDFVDDITVIWTATDPEDGRGFIVGWYKHARVYRERQRHSKYVSKQHRFDKVKSYIAETDAENTFCIPISDRTLQLQQGVHPGQVPWKTFANPPSAEQSKAFQQILKFMETVTSESERPGSALSAEKKSGTTSPSPYIRYMTAYEAQISPEHHVLQSSFKEYLVRNKKAEIQEDIASVDIRYVDTTKATVFAEIKPCNHKDVRYAIRTAMGQLLDYQQRSENTNKLLVVTGVEPDTENKNLALKNGFGIAFPKGKDFIVNWP